MGALHPGHLSLIQSSKKENAVTISSIFVNPTQFNDPGDFQKYPVTIEKDIDLLEEAGCDVLFFPSVEEIYPDGTKAVKLYDLGYLETILEGKFRPGHFQGVCMVVERLLKIVEPDKLYLGQKDFQQCMVIRKLITLMGKENHISLQISPTLRESDGLAMSSRNMRLDAEERSKAHLIFGVLTDIRNKIAPGDLNNLKREAVKKLNNGGFKVEYVEIANATDLQLDEEWDGREPLVALVAAYLGDVRLIDNMLLNN